MTREEIKQEILSNDNEQIHIIISAQFMALYMMLVKKGLISKNDIDEMNKITEKYIDELNEKMIDKIMEQLKEEE